MKVKVVFGDDVRRWREPESDKYPSLKAFVQDSFNFLDDSSFIIQYLDDENDKITISSEKDFEDAFICAQKEKRKSLKLFVSIAKSDLNLLKGESVDTDISSSDDCLSTDNSSSLSGEEEEEDNVKSPKNQDSNCTYWRESALDFLQNKEIELLLPEFVRRVVIALKNEQNKGKNIGKQEEEKKMDSNEDSENDKNDNEDLEEESKDFSTILIEILSEDKFKSIANHELIENKLPFVLPFISEKVSLYKHLLFLINEDVISRWIPHLISLLIDGLLKYKNISFDIEMDNNGDGGCDISSFIPQWFAYVTNENEKEKEKEEIIHKGVICDSCHVDGILGCRYKCLVCIDFDLCEKCSLSGKHDSSHPLIKLNLPFEKINEKDFEYGGLHETIRQLGGRRRVFGGRFGRGRGRGRGGRERFGRGGFGHHRFHRHHPHHHYHDGHGYHGYEQYSEAPFAFNQDEGFGYQSHEFEEFEGFSESPRGRGRRFGGRGGYVGFGHFAHNDHPHPHPHHEHHSHGRHGGQRRFMNDKHERKNFRRELKSERKEYKNELKNLKKLEKQMAKQCCRIDKQINKLNKQQAKEKAKKQAKKGNRGKGKRQGQKLCNDVLCICGEALVNVKASDAYPGSSGGVRCDICDCKRVGNSFIYHCPNNGALLHPSGYDICNGCAKTQQKSFVKNDKKEETKVKDNKVKKDKKDKKSGRKSKNSNDSGLASLSPLVEEPSVVAKDEIEDISIVKGDEFKRDDDEDDMNIELNGDEDNMKDDNVKDEVYENDKDDFIFMNELSQLEAMGFGNDEHIRALLIAKKRKCWQCYSSSVAFWLKR